MAIISSVALGKVRKSLGNVTLQHYYGKTVAKQKIVRNPNYVPSTKQEEQRARMMYAFKFTNAWDGLTDLLFVRSKWGTKRNNFVKQNYPAIAEYVKAHEALVLPQQGQFLNLLYMMTSQFNAYNKPVYVAKGIDASISPWLDLTGPYADGKTPLGFTLSVVDAMYKKVQARIIYFTCSESTSPFAAISPMNATPWLDLTLSNGIWSFVQQSLDIIHTAVIGFGYIFQVMIDDAPVTINVTGMTLSNNKAVGIKTLSI